MLTIAATEVELLELLENEENLQDFIEVLSHLYDYDYDARQDIIRAVFPWFLAEGVMQHLLECHLETLAATGASKKALLRAASKWIGGIKNAKAPDVRSVLLSALQSELSGDPQDSAKRRRCAIAVRNHAISLLRDKLAPDGSIEEWCGSRVADGKAPW